MKKILLIISFAFVFLHTNLSAQDIKIKTPEQVTVNSPFEMSYTIDLPHTQIIFTPPNFGDFNVLSGPVKSYNSTAQMVDGKMLRTKFTSYTYTLVCELSGEHTIGAAQWQDDTTTFMSNSISLNVLPLSSADSVKMQIKANEISLINNHVVKLEKAEQLELIKKIDDYIWSPELLLNTKKSNPARYKTMLNGNRLLVHGKITQITEETKYLGFLNKVVYNIILNSNIIIEVESAEEVSKYSMDDNIYALIRTADETKYSENLPVFYPVLENSIFGTSIEDVLKGMKSKREFDFDNPSKYVTSIQIWNGEDPDKMSLIDIFNQFSYNNLYIQYLLKIQTK